MLNRPFPPFFDDYEDGYYHGGGNPFHRAYYRDPLMSRRRAYEEARRRAEMERLKEQQLRRQREEELRRQREHEAYLRRLRTAEEQRRQRALAERRHSPRYSIVRGPDGYLYRVPTEYLEGNHEDALELSDRNLPEKRKKAERPKFVKAPDGRIYAVYDSSDDEPMEDDTSEAYIEEDSASEAMRMSPLASPKAPDAELKEHLRDMMETEPIAEKPIPLIKKKKPQHPGVIVEDVSDSEEEDELKSVWRNRRPGPGDSWMEPIEAP